MLKFVGEHFDRVKTAVEGTFSLANLDQYIERKTYLNGKPFSFKQHEFQRDILKGQAPTELTVKIAQVGLSEITYRFALAACRVMPDFSVIYTFPNASDAQNMCKTRIDPIIAGSPDLLASLNPGLDNSEIKQFGRNSFLYMKGTNSERGAISVPADMVIHDEWDRSDTTTGSMYIARLQHKPHKLRRLFSTPTIEKYGILKEAETSKRLRHIAQCAPCGYRWLPSYFNDVKVPGYNKELREITKQNIHLTRWREAYLACPKCGRDPQLAYERMEWVCENPNDDYQAVSRFISPFTVPEIITPRYLVMNSTQYNKYSEFMNQGLGIAAEDEDENITTKDIEDACLNISLVSSELHIFAADMGLICHVMIGRMTAKNELLVVHREQILLSNFEQRRRELLVEYRCSMSIHDCQPYVDMVQRLTKYDVNAYGALFATFKSGPLVRVQEQEEEFDEGKLNFRIAKIRRNELLDSLLGLFKRKEIKFAAGDTTILVSQLTSLKRVQKLDSNKDLSYIWDKTDENDHYHFALLYLYAAVQVRGLAKGVNSLMQHLAVVQRVRMRHG